MKYGLLIATILIGVLANAGFALDPKVFPGKGSRATWNKASNIYNQGYALSKQGNSNAAIQKYKEAIAIYPFADTFFFNLGFEYEARKAPGDLAKAEAAYREAAKLDPKDWRNWNALADYFGSQKRFRECRDAGVKALSCNPPPEKAARMKSDIEGLNKYLTTLK